MSTCTSFSLLSHTMTSASPGRPSWISPSSEPRGRELFRDGFAPHARFLGGHLRGLHRLARLVHALFGFEARFVELTQLRSNT